MGDDFDRIMGILCETAVGLVPVEHSHIVVFDPVSKSGTVCAEFPVKWQTLGKIVPAEEGFIERRLVKTINLIVIEDVEHDRTPAATNIRALNPAIKSTVVIPIVVDDDIRGAFAFNVLKKHEFTTEEIERFNSLGQVAAQIFKNAYLLKQTRMQTEKLDALRKAMLAITRERQREPLLRTIIEQAIKLLAAEGGGIYKYERRRRELELVEDYKWPKQVGVTLKPGEGLSGRLFLSNEKYLATPDYQNSEYKAAVIKEDVGSVLGVPLLWQNHRTGVLFVNGERGRNFTGDEAELLQRFAAMASIALEHSRLRERDRYMVERLQSLAKATNEIISRIDDADMDGQLTQIARNAHEILNAEACGIHQVIRPGYLTLVASDGHLPGDFRKGREFKIISGPDTGLTGHIAHERKPFRKCGEELSTHFAVANKRNASGCHSLLAIPLLKKTASGEELTGLIRISNKKGRRGLSNPWVCFTRADQSVAEVFAQAAAVVLAKTKLLDEIRNLNQAWNIILKAVNIDNALEELAMMLVTLLQKSFCRIFLIDESEKLLRIIAAVQREPKQFVWDPRPEGDVAFISEWRNLGRSFESGISSVLTPKNEDGTKRNDDIYNLKRLAKKLKISSFKNKPLGLESLLSIPLKVGNRKVGLITIGEIKGPDARGFSSSQIELARTIASQVTLLIDKESHQDELSRRQKLDGKLLNALAQIRATQTVEELFGVIVKQAASVFRPALDEMIIAGMIIEKTGQNTLEIIDTVHGARQLKKNKLTDLAGTFAIVAREEKSKIVYDFKSAVGEEAVVANYNFTILLATHITVSSDMRCILFVGDKMTWPRLSRADLEILERLGQHSGISLSKALVQEQANKRRAGNYLVAEAMALGELKVMLEKAVDGILKSMDCDTVTLYVLDSKKGQLKFPPELAGVKDKDAALKILEDEKESVIKRVKAIDDYHAAEDTLNDELLTGEFVRSQGIVSSAGIPITAQEKEKIGVMFVNYRRRHHFDENDRENMKYLAHQAAVAINNVRMYKKGNSQEIFLEALYQTERAISSSNDLQETLKVVAEHVWKVACANNRTPNVVSINRIENNRARVVAAHPPEELAHIVQALKGEIDLINGAQVGLVGVAFKEGKSKIFTGLKGDLNRHPQHIRLHSDTQSELVALIMDQDSMIVGAITVENSDEDAFDLDDLNVMETLARQAAVAIQKDKQTAVLEKLNRDIARKRAVSLVGVSTSIWRHKINNAANSISYAAEECLRQKTSQMEEFKGITDKLKKIATDAQDLKKMPVGVPLFARDERPNKAVNAMIRDHINYLQDNKENRAVNIKSELSAPEGTTIKINEEWFHAALSFFTQNSLRELKNSATKQLVLKTMIIQDGWCRIEVCDTGPGMDEQTWTKLFEPKAETPNSEGMGVGLLNAEFIIDEHGGVVHRISNSPNGVTVGFSLPTVS